MKAIRKDWKKKEKEVSNPEPSLSYTPIYLTYQRDQLDALAYFSRRIDSLGHWCLRACSRSGRGEFLKGLNLPEAGGPANQRRQAAACSQ